jgi:RHS repeat-associated protein
MRGVDGTSVVSSEDLLGEVSLAPLSGGTTYRHLDFRLNVAFVTDAAGEVTNHYRYGPYGVDHAYGAGQNHSTFVGKPEIGPFMLLGARILEPEIGRFLSPDPLFSPTNQYGYTSGNPIVFMDSSGLFEVTVGQVALGFGAVAVAAGIVAVLPVSGTIMIGAASLAEIAALTGAFARLGAFYYGTLGLVVGPDFPMGVGAVGSGGSPGGGSGGGGGGSGGGGSGGGGGGSRPNGGGDVQFKQISINGETMRIIATPPVPVTTCSPSTLTRTGGGRRTIAILLVVNLLFGMAWYRRRISERPDTRGTLRRSVEW